MRKKFTLLFASLLAFAGVAKAGVTDLPEMSTEGSIKYYTIKNTRSGKYANYAGDATKMTQVVTPGLSSLFYFTASDAETAEGFTPVMIHNAATANKLEDFDSWTAAGKAWYLHADVQNSTPAGLHIVKDAKFEGWNAFNDGASTTITNYLAKDAGSVFEISAVTDFAAILNVPAAKEAAKAELDNLAKISVLFSDATQAKADVDAVVAAGTGLAELNAAIEEINAVVVAYKKQIDGKNVRFTTKGRNTSDGHDMIAVAAGAAGATNSADAGIWTLTSNEDGTFKMYNFVSNLYLKGTVDQSQRVPTCESFADAAPYTFNVIEENTVNLLNNGNTLHLDGWANVVQWNENSAGASIWEVVSCNPIVVTREQYDAAAAAKETLPYAIQQAYGLVTDAANYYSNWKSEAEGSYEALLDNTSAYFHSAYSDEAKADEADAHYIQANLDAAVDEFYFYMAPRNANNRPVDITVSGSNDNETFEEIKQISTTLASTSSYFSEKLGTAGKSYKHIRLTVTSTNTGTKFFTLSELYFLSAEANVTSLIDSYKAFASSSITSETMATAATALINAEGTLALSNIKKEVAALLSANASNHAATPELGQYSTEGYNALNAAYTAANATLESLETAIAEFNASKNLPVFTINGVIGYAAGKSIYDEPGNVNAKGNTHYFKTTDKSDKTMWWALDMTTTEIGVIESVGIRNVGTGANFWGCPTIKITETEENEGAGIADDGIFLFYTTNDNNPIHAQNDGQLICRYSDKGAATGSAWTFTYIGNSYDLNEESGESTDIEAPAVVEEATVIYDLLGRRVEKMEKGFYIVNGKKVLVK